MSDSVYKETTGAPKITLKYYKPTNPAGRSFIPVEFAVAAYRFGHSITRPRYTVQDVFDSTGKLGAVSTCRCSRTRPTENNLNGHRELPARLKIQWSKFFNAADSPPLGPCGSSTLRWPARCSRCPQRRCPTPTLSVCSSQRNLRRGRKMGLPSGQQVARLMGVTPLTNAQLSQNHRINVRSPSPATGGASSGEYDEENQSLKEIFADTGWGGEAPLWFYILKEAEIVGKGRALGPVGGRIVAEVLVGLLQKDPNSYLYLNAGWKPAPPIAPASGQFTMADLLKFAKVWS